MQYDNKNIDLISSDYLYKGKVLNLRIDKIRTTLKKNIVREIAEHSPAVAVVVLNPKNQICLVSQYRHAINAKTLEIPAGLVDEGESPLEAAKRELFEETGIKAINIEKVLSFYTSPGFSTELIHLYYVSDYKATISQNKDDAENISVFWHSIHDVLEKIKMGSIKDAKTILACYWYVQKRR